MLYTPVYPIDVVEQETVKVYVFEFGGFSIEAKTEEEARQHLIEHIMRVGVESFVKQSKVHVTDEHPF